MKKHLVIYTLLFLLAACDSQPASTDPENGLDQETVISPLPDEAKVHVVYFHGKQRCPACLAIQSVASEIVTESFGDNPDVMFVEIDFSKRENYDLAEKYEIAWSSLIIIAGDRHVDLTEDAFANAVRNPEKLKELIIEHTSKYL